MSSFFSPSLLIHVAGVFSISQLILIGSRYREDLYSTLNSNATSALQEAVGSFLNTFSAVWPLKSSVIGAGTLLQILLYSVATLYALHLIRSAWKALFGEIELYCPSKQTGFEFPRRELSRGHISKQEFMNEVRRRKRIGEIPPPYPNGWFGLVVSKDLKVGESTSVSALGQNFAVFRDEEGKAHILDAYCAHLGANLAIGGKVIGNCLECPFHGWQYDGETGQCAKIPYSKGKIPSQAKVKAWPCVEVNGYIFVWHDAEDRDPDWFPEQFEQIKDGHWTYRGYSTHFMNAHIEDIPENGADISHLTYLHGTGIASGSDVNFKKPLSGKLHGHEWNVKWEALPAPTSHIGRMTMKLTNVILGARFKAFEFNVVADQIGPGIVYLTVKTFIGSVLLMHTVTPQEPLLQKYSLLAFSDWWIPTFIIKLIIQGYDVQLERDMIVWNNKRYKYKPVLVKEDELIVKHRRWYSQFYSENSSRFSFTKDDLTF